MDEAKKRRSQRAGVITRHIHTLDRLCKERDVTGVRDRLKQMKFIFNELESAHYAYIDALEAASETPEGKIGEEDKWFEKAATAYLDAVDKAHDWLDEREIAGAASQPLLASNGGADLAKSASSVTDSRELATLLSLPKVEIPVFSGDPREYKGFITVFDHVIGDVLHDDQAKLSRLIQHLAGDARRAISSCMLMSPDAGYLKAREVLKKRFGSPHIISQSIINDLKCGKPAVKPADLRKLADDVSVASLTLKGMGAYTEVNTQQCIKDILNRCHSQVKARWRTCALKQQADKGEYPDFEAFVEFLDRAAVEACDPVYGYDEFKLNPKSVKVNQVNSNPTGSPALSEGQCCICREMHTVMQCAKFKSMKPDLRLKLARKYKLCFVCLSRSHMSFNCPESAQCPVEGCSMHHCQLLHTSYTRNGSGSAGNTTSSGNSGTSGASVTRPPAPVAEARTNAQTNVCHVSDQAAYLPLVSVLINGVEPAVALLDTGSTTTLVTERLCRRVGLTGENVTCSMSTVGGEDILKTRMVSFQISPVISETSYMIRHACVVPEIPAQMPETSVDWKQCPHLADLPLDLVPPGAKADLLLGQDHAYLLTPLEVRSADGNREKQPYAIRTEFGWCLHGPVMGACSNQSQIKVNNARLAVIENEVDNLWNIEHEDESLTSWSPEDRFVHEMWERDTILQDGRYTVPIPWRPEAPCFPDNLVMAEKRLDSTLKRLQRTGMYSAYQDNIHKLVEDGHAEMVPEDLLSRQDGKVWYIPHHAVVNEEKGKVRIVFDCAAKHQGTCLNEQSFSGPVLCNKLLHVLIRFRQYPYAIVADIRSMYLQVRIPEDQRDCLRFLWREDGQLYHYRMTSHLFGGTWCASSSTYALRRVLQDFEAPPVVCDAVNDSMYVDDLLASLPSREQARELVQDIPETLHKGGFHLTKYISNAPDLLNEVPIEDRAMDPKIITPNVYSKALGIRWDVVKDEFVYQRKSSEALTRVTKRAILSLVAAMYDPLGLILPIVIKGRILFQDATILKLGWDDEVPPELATRWNTWWAALESLTDLRFDRCLVPEKSHDGAMELHHFCDASQSAYGVCTYLRILTPDGRIHTQLVMAKARVAPMRPMTIPRLELQAAVLAVSVEEVLRRVLQLDLLPSTFWSDSQVVLSYIRSESSRFKVFVGNRIARIRECSSPSQWSHISTKENPADILSRGCLPTELPSTWFSGPSFLQEHRDGWPSDAPIAGISIDDPEVKVILNAQVQVEPAHPLDTLIGHYSSLHRLKKAVSWLIRWVRLCKGDWSAETGMLSVQELKVAEDRLIAHVQGREYAAEIAKLQSGDPVRKTSSIRSLCPRLIDGKLVVGGRLKHAQMSDSARNPVIIPARHALSRLVLLEAHDVAHLGTEWVLARLRTRYWIPGARNALRGIRRKCVTCQRKYGAPASQLMADLPPERLQPFQSVFHNTGVDLFGPFMVSQGRSRVKRYGCIFTCLAVRAIHLEVLPSLETDAFINGLQRFCARRGCPATIRSDRGTNLVGASVELGSEIRKWDKGKIQGAMRLLDVQWFFNPPTASHQGGIWERMIRTVRKVLMAVMPAAPITDDVLSTVFCQVEGIVNSRPLTKCSDDVKDDIPLTPNHFLLLQDNVPLGNRMFHSAEVFRKKWKQASNIVNSFWRRWLKEYLPELQRRSKWMQESPDFKTGDLVLMMEENAPRGQWPLALVTDVHVGRDGHVRSVRLRVRGSELVRPITKLVPLELC